MIKELEQLYEYLKLNYNPLIDLSLREPDEDEDTDYICCDQKIITFVDGYYNICDLYDSHPCVRFKSKDEVIAFYNGQNDGLLHFDTDVDIAYSVGKLYYSSHTSKSDNVSIEIVISPIQKLYNL